MSKIPRYSTSQYLCHCTPVGSFVPLNVILSKFRQNFSQLLLENLAYSGTTFAQWLIFPEEGMENELLSRHFEKDHERLANLLKQYQAFKAVDYARAKENFEAFQFGLRRHMAWEEDVLFPLFERKTGIESGGATDVLRQHHQNIRSYLQLMERKIAENNRDTQDEETLFLDLLEIHDQMEEDVLYPVMDQLVTDVENDAALIAIRNIREEKFAI